MVYSAHIIPIGCNYKFKKLFSSLSSTFYNACVTQALKPVRILCQKIPWGWERKEERGGGERESESPSVDNSLVQSQF
jgi:hypothetical protein